MDQTTDKKECKCDAAANKQCMCNGCEDCQANARKFHKDSGHYGDGIEA